MTIPYRETNGKILCDQRVKGFEHIAFIIKTPSMPRIIHITNNPNVTNGSLSTFDSSVSCLYFFETESRNTCLKKHSGGRVNIRAFGEERATRLYR